MKYRILSICVLLSVCAAAQTKTTKPSTTTKSKTTTTTKTVASNTPALRNALDSFSYAMGMSMGNFCNKQGIGSVNTSMVLKGLGDGNKAGKALLTEQQMNQVISSYLSRRNADKAKVAKEAGQKFLEANAKKAGVTTLASGLQYTVLKAGTDTTRPKLTDKVKCHYRGTLIDGTEFESSYNSGQPIEFSLNGVIAGWTEALQLMTPGSKWRLFIPSDLAYGDQQAGPQIAPGSTLIFDVELLEIVKE